MKGETRELAVPSDIVLDNSKDKLAKKLVTFKKYNLNAKELVVFKKRQAQFCEDLFVLTYDYEGISKEQLKQLDQEELYALYDYISGRAQKRAVFHKTIWWLGGVFFLMPQFIMFQEWLGGWRPSFAWDLLSQASYLEKIRGKEWFPYEEIASELKKVASELKKVAS